MHKSFGEALTGLFLAAGKPAPMSLGHFFLAIDVEAICDLEAFDGQVMIKGGRRIEVCANMLCVRVAVV